jgi:glutaredoxin
MTQPGATATRELHVEFLYLDLDTCTHCRATDTTLLEAIARTRPALDAAGVTVHVTKTLVASETQARELGFVSSPTIRINGADIAGELLESACENVNARWPHLARLKWPHPLVVCV